MVKMTDLRKIEFPVVWNPSDNIVYVDDPYRKQPTYEIPLMNVAAYMASLPHASKAASVNSPLEEIYFNNGKEEYNFLDKAISFTDAIHQAQQAGSPLERRSKAAALITSTDYSDFQNVTIIGQSTQAPILRGITKQQFETISLPNLSGKFASFDDDLRWLTNIPEGKSPEPSGGFGSTITVSVQKHGGAVAITERAEMVINGDNPFPRLVSRLQDKREQSENAMVVAEIEGNTAHTQAGVDAGLRSGTPPVSQTNPEATITALIGISEGLNKPFNLMFSKGFIFNEWSLNDVIRGAGNLSPLPTQTNINESTSPFPAYGGVTWVKDNAFSSSTAGWIMNSDAIKNFVGPTRAYTVADPDAETRRYVTKAYFSPDTVEAANIYEVTGIAA